MIVGGAVMAVVPLIPTEEPETNGQTWQVTELNEEPMPKQEETTPIEETVTNPAPLPASQPVIAPTQAPPVTPPGLSIAEEARQKVTSNLKARVPSATANEEFVQWYCFEKVLNQYADMNDRSSVAAFINDKQNWVFESTGCRAMNVEKQASTQKGSRIA